VVVEQLLARIRVHLANARMTHETHIALDATGRFLLATDRSGKLLWCTPKAKQLLSEIFPAPNGQDTNLPASFSEQLLRLRHAGARDGGSRLQPRCAVEAAGRRIECSFMSSVGPDELLFRLAETGTSGEQQRLQQELALTAREAEVLLWISRGKSNRDIGEILQISPRTVNKHLEQIFVKLGVENRASAAAQAVRALPR
jgi:DNA-binding CsgD family transcriptional regulator